MAEISCEVDGFTSFERACAVLLVEEIGNKVIANHRQEVSIAHRTVFGLWDVDLFIRFVRLFILFI